jgi:integrase/recombinase XerD
MTERQRRAFIRKPGVPLAPGHRPMTEWPPVNYTFYRQFRDWLFESGYSPSALNLYGIAARLVFSLIDVPYWRIDLDADLNRVRAYLTTQYASPGTRQTYLKGVAKLEHYLRLRCHTPPREKAIHWHTYLGALPDWLADEVRVYYTHCRRAWLPDRQHERSVDWLSHLTRPLRGIVARTTLTHLGDLTPDVWFDYLDARLTAGLQPTTLNDELRALQGLLGFLDEQGRPVCRRMLRVDPLDNRKRLPRDVPIDQLRRLLRAVDTLANSSHRGVRRMGLMDRAWMLLMLHSGLRTGEVRRLRLSDIDWANRRVRIEQSKGLKDRQVCLSAATIDALKAYLAVRGPADALPEQVFIFQHAPLSESFCGTRLRKTYAPRCGVRITPHQLRHSCATLLLNAGAPILTVQTILGHKHVDTTLGYARLYDGTVAADYYRAMAQVERRLALEENVAASPPCAGELLALVDSLRSGTLNEAQLETVRTLRAGIVALAERDAMPVTVDTAGLPG